VSPSRPPTDLLAAVILALLVIGLVIVTVADGMQHGWTTP
jgi:hypothetical protein